MYNHVCNVERFMLYALCTIKGSEKPCTQAFLPQHMSVRVLMLEKAL